MKCRRRTSVFEFPDAVHEVPEAEVSFGEVFDFE